MTEMTKFFIGLSFAAIWMRASFWFLEKSLNAHCMFLVFTFMALAVVGEYI